MSCPEEFIGSYISVGYGYTTEEGIRRASASGGLVTALILNALRRGIIDGALVTVNEGVEQRVILARTYSEVLKSSGSKYMQLPFNACLTELMREEGRFAVVALPCQIRGLRKLEVLQRDLKDKIAVRIGLVCSHAAAPSGISYLLSLLDVEPKDVSDLKYRAKMFNSVGFYLRTTHGKEVFVPAKVYYGKFFSFFFIPRGCMQCTDMTAEAADISIGNIAFMDESLGYSFFIIRTDEGEKFFEKAMDENIVAGTDIDPWKIIKSQPYYRIKKGKAIRAADNLLIPTYKIARRLGYVASSRKKLHFVMCLWAWLCGVSKHPFKGRWGK